MDKQPEYNSWNDLPDHIKKDTEPWILNEGDRKAASAGMFWSLESAAYTIWWIERFCKLYEGAGFAGKPLYIHGYASQPEPEYIHDFYEDLDYSLDVFRERFKDYFNRRDNGDHLGWQLDFFARCYGWKMYSSTWARKADMPYVRRFKSASIFIPKKSGKSPTLAANVVYLTYGDGEPGNKVFIGAGNMDQAGIAWEHAYQMVQQSPELLAVTKPNLSTKKIQDLNSKSHFIPLSSGDKRSQSAKEGLNGSCCLDELHVLDPEYVAILKYMGVSRAEPLKLGFSTAGRNPELYGKLHYDEGERINAGIDDNPHHLHIAYSIPQDLAPEDLAKDPEGYIAMANPALNHTVEMEELLASYHAVKNDSRELREFMMYRLNQFQNAAASWLNPGVWHDCGTEFDEQELKQLQCVGGLDLARRHDLAALVLAFLGNEQDDGTRPVYLRPYFWCAEDIIKERVPKIHGFLDWTRGGYIKETPGNVIDFGVIERDIRKVCENYNVKGLVYDATYAEDLIQRLTEGVQGPDGNYVYPPISIGERAMSQSIVSMTQATTDFENDCKSGIIRHDNNPVLSWQIGNASIKENNNGDIKVVKESRESPRTVDGVVAAIMARWGLIDCLDFNISSMDYYVSNDVEFF